MKYFKVLKNNHSIGVIVAEEQLNKNFKVIAQSVILDLRVNCIFYEKQSINREEFEDIMKCLNLGCCPKSELPILFEEF
jgi:hypothetical protein